jgi:hypothetical protein
METSQQQTAILTGEIKQVSESEAILDALSAEGAINLLYHIMSEGSKPVVMVQSELVQKNESEL